MQKIKSFFIKVGQWCKNAAVKTGGWCKRTAISAWGWTKKTASITWKWALAHKAAASVIAGAAVLAITTAIVVPVTVSSAKRREAEQQTQQGEGEQTPPGEGGGSSDSHTHTYAEAWTTSATEHWHASTCGHEDEKGDKAEHTFSDWIENPNDDTEDIRTCSVCNFIESRAHQHSWGTTWSMDVDYHWKDATCSHASPSLYNLKTEHSCTKTLIAAIPGQYKVEKGTCGCGLEMYYKTDWGSGDYNGSLYTIFIKELVVPTYTTPGKAVFYYDYDDELITLNIPAIGKYSVTTVVEPAYKVTEDSGHYTAQLRDEFAYGLGYDTEYEEVIAILNVLPGWTFEVDEQTYNDCRWIYEVYFYEPPTVNNEGTLCIEYENYEYEYLTLPKLTSTNNWTVIHQEQGTYQDNMDFYKLNPEGPFVQSIENEYLRFEVEFACCDDDYDYNCGYSYDHYWVCSNTSLYCDNWSSSWEDEGYMRVEMMIEFGCVTTGDTLSCFKEVKSDGDGRGKAVGEIQVDAIYRYTNDGKVKVPDEEVVYASRYEAYEFHFKAAWLGSAYEDVFETEPYFVCNNSTTLNYRYGECFG